MVKAQIHAGGRGKAGGVKVVKSVDDVQREAARMLGATWSRTRPARTAKMVNRLYVEEGSAIETRVLPVDAGRPRHRARRHRGLDRRRHGHRAGGARHAREDRHDLDRSGDRHLPHHAAGSSQALGLDAGLQKQLGAMLTALYPAFVEKDMSLLEVNPLVVTTDGKLVCLDAKIGFDDNALFRHPEVAALRDETEEDEKEIEASKYDLNYVALDGSIGCMVNGAGLAMATMDIIKLYGMEPANFLDVGGSASQGEGGGGVQDHHRRSAR